MNHLFVITEGLTLVVKQDSSLIWMALPFGLSAVALIHPSTMGGVMIQGPFSWEPSPARCPIPHIAHGHGTPAPTPHASVPPPGDPLFVVKWVDPLTPTALSMDQWAPLGTKGLDQPSGVVSLPPCYVDLYLTL